MRVTNLLNSYRRVALSLLVGVGGILLGFIYLRSYLFLFLALNIWLVIVLIIIERTFIKPALVQPTSSHTEKIEEGFPEVVKGANIEKLLASSERAQNALKQKNEELAKMLQTLKSTQQELAHKEKMASLGQLMAGVAHEINTPFGAIYAAATNINEALEDAFEQLPLVLIDLPEHHFSDLFALVNAASYKGNYISSREERTNKHQIKQFLEQKGIDNGESIASSLAHIGFDDPKELEPFLPLLTSDKGDLILKTIYHIVTPKKDSQNIINIVERASKVVSALKNYTYQSQTEIMQDVNIPENIDMILTLYQSLFKADIEVIREYEKVPPIRCYVSKFDQVWTNLIQNAVQAMKGKGVLRIKVKKIEDEVMVAISDNGFGVPEEIKDKIFKPFFTTKSFGEGNGLGLDIVHSIVTEHQGSVSFESQTGQTTFYVHLPIQTT